MSQDNVVIVSGVRTPMGGFMGSLAPVSAPELGAIAIAEAVKRAGLDPARFVAIDNACPDAGTTTAGVSAAESAKEKLEWKDVFELTEWFRPCTIKRAENFDPTKM